MKNIAKKLFPLLMAGLMTFPNSGKSQTNENLNFYSKDGSELSITNKTYLSKFLSGWVSREGKGENDKVTSITYGDRDNDGRYDYVSIKNRYGLISLVEEFTFNFRTKEFDYDVKVKEDCDDYGYFRDNCPTIAEEDFPNIDLEEGKAIGIEFVERINDIVKIRNKIGRFNTDDLEKLVRKEYSLRAKVNGVEIYETGRMPLNKFLTKDDFDEIKEYFVIKKQKEEQERIEAQKAREERQRIAREKAEAEKEKMEKKKLKNVSGSFELGVGSMKTLNSGPYYGYSDSPTGGYGEKKIRPYVETDVLLNILNGYKRGVSFGADIQMVGSEFDVYEKDFKKENERTSFLISNHYMAGYNIKETTTNTTLNVKNTSRVGIRFQYTSPITKLFIGMGRMGQKMSRLTDTEIETYDAWDSEGESPLSGTKEKENNQETFEWKKGALYFSTGLEITPFHFEDEGSLSFFIEFLGISANNYSELGERNQGAMKFGLRYLIK